MPATLERDLFIDTSAVLTVRDERRAESKQESSSTFAGAAHVSTKPSAFYDIEAGKIFDAKSGKLIGLLKRQLKVESGGTANLTINSKDLLDEIESFLADWSADSSVPSETPLEVTTETISPYARQAEIAQQFVANLSHLITRRGLQWREPAVAHEEYNNTVEISWWRADKALIFTVAPSSPIAFLQVWGPDMQNEMEDGVSPSGDDLLALWQWLYPN
jgi:hypothetical protein